MSKMNELSIDAQETLYEEYIESQRDELRREGGKEVVLELLRIGALTDSGTGLYQFVSISADGMTSRNFVDLRGLI